MMLTPTRVALAEQCRQVVLFTTVDAVSATYACALATSPLVPQNCRVLVWDVSSTASTTTEPSPKGTPSNASLSSVANGKTAFARTVARIEARMRERRAPRPKATVTHMTQFFYGGVAPKEEEIRLMLQRIDVCHDPCTDVAAAIATGALAVEDSVFVLALNSQSLGTDTEMALEPYKTFLRVVWGSNPHSTGETPSSVPSVSSTPRRQGSLIVVADEGYRTAACTMVKTIAAEVLTTVDWFVQLAYVHALDPPALEYGATEVAVEGHTGLTHGGTLPVLCAANALGVLRHFPVSRSEPSTVTPVDVALNAALLGHIFLRCGELPECNDVIAGTDASVPPARHHMASFAVAESHKPAEASLVWGMFGEYLLGYYGRFAEHICAAFPVAGVITDAPLLQFPFSVRDVVNFGPEPRCPAYLFEGWRAYQRRKQVTADFHGEEVRCKMQLCVQQLDTILRAITDAARAAVVQNKSAAAAVLRRRASATSTFAALPYGLDDFNVAVYQRMLRRLTMHYSLMPYHQFVALSEVDWEAYISVIAKAVLVHLAKCVLQRTEDPLPRARRLGEASSFDIASIEGMKSTAAATASTTTAVTESHGSTAQSCSAESTVEKVAHAASTTVPFNFPEPRRSFTNDLIYHGDERIPPFPSLTRQYFTCATYLHRTALKSNGWRSDMVPGMTPKMLTAILSQSHIQQLMTAIAAKDGATKTEVEAQAKKILLDTGDTLNHLQCRTMGLIIRETFRRIYYRVNVNHGAFERLHRQLRMPRVALVYVPLHRSYVDFLIMSFLLAEMQSPLPHIVAGDGFLSMGPVATLMRGSGAFFMRRTFRGDPLYAALFKEYVRQMILSYQPLEFFIEGTRSRTGKTMAPKMGILKFICDTFFDPVQQELDDVLFIPVSISYDELLEATIYAKELLGVPKPKETLANFLKASSTLKRMHGSIHLHMCDTLSLRSLKEHPQQCPLPYQPKSEPLSVKQADPVSNGGGARQASNSAAGNRAGASELSPRSLWRLDTTPTIAKPFSPTPPSILSSVAWHITYQLQQNTVITPASIVAALLECLSPYYSIKTPTHEREKRDVDSAAAVDAAQPAGKTVGVPLSVIEQGVMWLRGILQERGARLSVEAATWGVDRVIRTALGNLCSFAHLTNGMSTVSYRQPGNLVARLGVNISTNQLIHVCIDEALVVVVSQAFGTPSTPHSPPTAARATVCGTRTVKSEVLANHTQLLQRLLSTEFPNYAAGSPVSFASWLECTVSRLQYSQPLAAAAVPPEQTPSASTGEAATSPSNGLVVTLPVTQYYYFLLQLICPHIESLYVVLLAALALLKAFPGQPLGAADVVSTTQKACRSLYEEGYLNYAVTANKDTLQHYYESLIALSLLRLGRLPVPPPQPTASAAKKKKAMSQGAVAYEAGGYDHKKTLERLGVLVSQVQQLLWYPGTDGEDGEGAVDASVIQDRVLKVYREVTQPSKM